MRRLLLISFLLFGLCHCRPQQLANKTFRSNATLLLMDETKVSVNTLPLRMVSAYQDHQDFFSVVDGMVSQQVFLFQPDGQLKQTVGVKGQGPGEYQGPTAFTATSDRFYVIGMMDAFIHIYDRQGTFLFRKPLEKISGIIHQLLPLSDDRILAVVTSKYSEKCFHVFDRDGNFVSSFFDTPKEFQSSLDTFFPPSQLTKVGGNYMLSFNFAYEVHVLDAQFKKIETLTLASPRYQPPDLAKSTQTKDHQTELAYRGSFTQFNGLYQTNHYTVTSLTSWLDTKTPYPFLEFWTEDFQALGYYEIPESETFLGIQGDRLIFYSNDAAALIFRKLRPSTA